MDTSKEEIVNLRKQISGITHTVLELKKDFFRQMRSEKKKICHLLV